jgi:hypothetical protein
MTPYHQDRARMAVDDLKKHPRTDYSLRRAYEACRALLKAEGLPLDWPTRGRWGLPSSYGPDGGWGKRDDGGSL